MAKLTDSYLYLTLLMLINTVRGSYISVVENSTSYIKCGKSTRINPVVNSKWLNPSGHDATLRQRFTITDNGTLMIQNVQRGDAGQYKCSSRIKTDRGLTPKTVLIYLNVEYPPTIDHIKPYLRVFQHSNIILPCSAKGNPGVTFQWRYPNRTIIADSKKYHLYSNGSLLVRNVQRKDVFTYTCTPYNDVGEGVYGYTRLDILIPPSFIHGNRSDVIVEVQEGGKTSLSCNVTGIPKPNITWRFINTSKHIFERKKQSDVFKLEDIKGVESGEYVCSAESIAGVVRRSFHVRVIGRPTVPDKFSVVTNPESIAVSWKPSYNGGSMQEFEVWYRECEKSDYDWLTIIANSSNNRVILDSKEIADDANIYHYYSLRARNDKGFSDFTPVIKAKSSALPDEQIIGESIQQISKNPLEPSQLIVNVSSYGYNLTWRYMPVTPGRPPTARFIIEYREANSTTKWSEIRTLSRSRRAVTSGEKTSYNSAAVSTTAQILSQDIAHVEGPLDFQVSSVTKDNIRSMPSKPSEIYSEDITAAGSGGRKGDRAQVGGIGDEGEDLIPSIVLGSIFGIFVIILLVSIYCFCRKKNRCNCKKDDKIALVESKPESNDGSGKADNIKFNAESPRRFHVSTCPALQLGETTSNNNEGDDTKRQSDDVFMLVEPHEDEKHVCTCNKKYLTLGHKPTSKKHTKKTKVLYKSTSSPSILLSESDDVPLDTTELLADEDFEVSELEEDDVAELDASKILPHLERSAFKDSYDVFCRSDSIDACFKDHVAALRVSEEAKNTGPDETKDADASSSGTVESDIVKDPTSHDSDGKSSDSKSSDGKSSGFGEGVLSNHSSNHYENFNPISRFVPLINRPSRTDTGYYSDASSGLSPLELMNRKYSTPQTNKYATIQGHHTQYLSEDEGGIPQGSFHRPKKPPSYNQAIVDIERMSVKSDKTDNSDKSFDHLLEMERQLGVRLINRDSDADSDLTTRSLMTSRYRHSIPRNYFSDTGYTSDIQSGAWRDRYTNREKTLRCNQLLEEFKNIRKSEQTIPECTHARESTHAHPMSPSSRPYSLVDNIIPEEDVVVKQRKHSTSSNYNEWLV